MLDRYELSEVLDAGVSATVWRAHDPMTGLDVAIKVLADESADDPDMRERFLAEARLALQGADPDGVRVQHVAESADRNIPYFVMAIDAVTFRADSHAPAIAFVEPEMKTEAVDVEPEAEPGFVGDSTLPPPRKMLTIFIVAMLVPAVIIGLLVVSNLGGDTAAVEGPETTVAPTSVDVAADTGQPIPEDFPVPQGAVLDEDRSVDDTTAVYSIADSPDRLVVLYSSFEGWRVVSSTQRGDAVSIIVSDGTNNVLVVGELVGNGSGTEITQLTITSASLTGG